jgi:hypothetical protein
MNLNGISRPQQQQARAAAAAAAGPPGGIAHPEDPSPQRAPPPWLSRYPGGGLQQSSTQHKGPAACCDGMGRTVRAIKESVDGVGEAELKSSRPAGR